MKKLILFLLLFASALSAQVEVDPLVPDSLPGDSTGYVEDEAMLEEESAPPYAPPPLQPLPLRDVGQDRWEKAAEGLDYSKDLPPERDDIEMPRSSGFDWGAATQGWGTVIQVLAILFATILIGYGVYWMMRAPRDRKLASDGTVITLANLDEHIHETDLDRFLREALAAADWPLAVRIYFLQSIKKLSEKRVIAWSREKTNRDYLREMRAHRLSARFREATHAYERVWYGNQSLSAAGFAAIEPTLQAFLVEIEAL